MNCQYCSGYSCTLISNDDVSAKCDEDDPGNTPNEIDGNVTSMVTTIVISTMVSGVVVWIIIAILIYCFCCKQRSHENSGLQDNLSTSK